jgi:hypothetical protein
VRFLDERPVHQRRVLLTPPRDGHPYDCSEKKKQGSHANGIDGLAQRPTKKVQQHHPGNEHESRDEKSSVFQWPSVPVEQL